MGIRRIWIISAVCLLGILSAAGSMDTAYAVPPDKATYNAYPPFMANTPPPLVMLVMGKNHKLFYEAYNDSSDLDDDGKIDVGYKPDSIDYYGYFDSHKSYSYDSTSGQFNPVAVISDKKVAHGSGLWSGDFLNYLTMSRMDAIRKVLYGGYRVIDSASETVLERAYIPQDAHSWGKEYESIARDGYDIRDYTPLDLPVSSPTQTRHLFACTSLYPPTNSSYKPLLRVLDNSTYRIWEWVSIEHPVAGTKCLDGTNGPNCAHAGGTTWMTVPNDASMGISNVTQTFYATSGTSHPSDHASYDTYVATYATTGNLQGSRSLSTINGSGDPFDGDGEHYMDLIDGTLNVSTAGTYTFSVDGDDAVEFLIDINGDGDFDDANEVVAGWYGGHGQCGCNSYSGSVTLTAGSYTFQFRHEEVTGGDNYYLRWQQVTPTSSMTDYRVRVKVADASMPESNCKKYPDGNYKPIGLLQRNGETDSMYFGLISGSYDHNMSGGVLRKKMGSITDEIDPDNGVFTTANGIIRNIDRFRIIDYNYSGYAYNGGWVTDRPMNEGEFPDWGNPVGEMMYEALRYFAGKKTPTTAYSDGTMSDDASLGLTSAAWDDPYDAATGFPSCSKPFMLVISDINPTFDSDELPGTAFGSFSGDLGTLDVASLGQAIGSEEGISGSYYIGDDGGTTDSSCSAKNLTGLGDIRGLCPEEPTKRGSYYSASVAYYGHVEDISAADGNQYVGSYMVGMASPLPRISIMVGNQPMTMVPFAKSVGGCLGVDPNTSFQPTNTIVDFYVDTLDPDNPTYGKFRINYEDVEQGADHDMDAIVEYTFQVYQSDGVTPAVTAPDGTNNGTMVKVTLNSTYAAGCVIQHIGYIISGTTADGTYLEVRDLDTGSGSDVDYHLDTPNIAGALPLMTTRTFYPGTDTAASLLKDPFWYAAKWGAFAEGENDANGVPDKQEEWDEDLDGVPDTYYYVTNPLRLEQQLSRSFADILSKTSSGTAAAVVANNSEGQGTMLQAFFKPSYFPEDGSDELTWVGYLRSLWVDQFGHLREDSNHDFKFNYESDKILEYGTDKDGNVFVKRYLKHYHYKPDNEFDEKCVISDCATTYETIPIDNIETLFAAGDMLHHQQADKRNIFTFIDGNGYDDDSDGNIDQSGEVEGGKTVGEVSFPLSDAYDDTAGEVVQFSTATANLLKPFLGLKDATAFSYLETGTPDIDTRVANLINYIRGVDSSGLVGQPPTRNRTLDGEVWKLGDIVRSTPVSVAGPIDNYDLIYSDESYLTYLRKYADRETVVYTGANDGMLHAFTHGKYTLDTSSGIYGYDPVAATPIGQEIWAYIPQSLLPHLKWLADPDYGHSFYVDLKPKVFDARIFTPDTDHPEGWGTLLLVGLGAGGKDIWAEGDFDQSSGTADVTRKFYPSYFCMDITNPRTPRLLWERSYEHLGFASSFPSVMQVGATFNSSTSTWSGGKWYAVMGSGPHDAIGKTDYNGYSDQNGYIFVVDLKTGELLRSFDTGWPKAVMASAVGLDKGSDNADSPVRALTYNVDAVYIGGAAYTGTGSDFTGKMFKINTRYPADVPSDDPNKWGLSTLFDTDRPISASPTLTVDKEDNAWVLFGTGRFQEMNDRATTQQQYLFGLKDPYFSKQYDSSDSANYNGLGNYYHNNSSAVTLTRGRLFYSNPYESFDNAGTVTGGLSYISDWDTLLAAVRNTDQADHPDYFDGWYRELDPRSDVTLPSERVISKPALLGGVMFTPIYIPDEDICGFGGSTDIYGLYYETGTPMWRHIFNTDTATPGGSVAYRAGTLMNTGPPPPTVSLHTGRQSGTKIFTQTGLGPVMEVEAKIPIPESDVLYWKELIDETPAP